MPQYTYICSPTLDGCGHTIQFECLMSELDKSQPKSCPKCKKRKSIQPVFSVPQPHIPKTLGSAADKNTANMSADEREHLTIEHNKYKDTETSWIPTSKGMVHKDTLQRKR